MNLQEHSAAEKIGWHVIARGGDMTARVHGGMYLGQGPSGEISFEPLDGIVELTLEGNQLKLTAVRADEEFLVPGEQPTRTVLVSPQTHVSLCFRHHILDIDNDFALARAAGSSLTLEVIDAEAAAARQARKPVSAGRRLRSVSSDSNHTVAVFEVGPSLWKTPADHLVRTKWQGLSPAVKRPLVIGGALFGIVAALLAVAVYLPTRLAGEGPSRETARSVDQSGVARTLLEESKATDEVPADPVEEPSEAVSDALLDRVTVLISAERLPDRGMLDFMVETLKSLQVAYPSDARVPEALNLLALRLLDEARAAYDGGNALQAGRLIELAVTTGAAPSAVEETLAGMTGGPADAGNPVPAATAATAASQAAAPDLAADAGTDESSSPSPTEAAGPDALVLQTTGVPLDALVDPTAEVDADGTLMLDDPAADPVRSAAGASPADGLPTGFALEDTAASEQPSGPVYRAFDQLTVTRRAPLVYPPGAPRRRSGSVDVSFTISESGNVVDVTAESELGAVFVEAARQTIARWRFEPMLVNGQPAPVKSAIRVTYRD